MKVPFKRRSKDRISGLFENLLRSQPTLQRRSASIMKVIQIAQWNLCALTSRAITCVESIAEINSITCLPKKKNPPHSILPVRIIRITRWQRLPQNPLKSWAWIRGEFEIGTPHNLGEENCKCRGSTLTPLTIWPNLQISSLAEITELSCFPYLLPILYVS